MMHTEGVLPVLKPVDFTSHDVVAVIRRILRIKRVGHTGTLDPMVTGVLPICIGKATRVVEYIQDLPKAYEAVLTIGIATDTEDNSGHIIAKSDNVKCSEDEIKKAVFSFVGSIEQTPPMYSAVKVNGKRLYELARLGQEVDRKSRTVTIHEIQILHMDLNKPYPEIKFRVVCSKGTYIRTLCVDIGKALGFPAVMSELVRTSSGHIPIDQCLTLSEIEKLHEQQKLHEHLIPIDQAIRHLRSLTISQEHVQRALQGQKIKLSYLIPFFHEGNHLQLNEHIRLYAPNEKFLGIFQIDLQNELIKPIKVFS